MKHVWITDGKEPLVNYTMSIDFEVTEEDQQNALLPKHGKGEVQVHPRRKSYQLMPDM